jgi:antitoxin (DNA-binding transcriptional repressor) of toxin-antitoxin stability system
VDKKYSIAEARHSLPAIVRDAECSGTVCITRRGEIVARLIAEPEFHRLIRRRRRIDWGTTRVDTRGFEFDRE